MKKPILIFPAGMPRSLEFLEKALSEGSEVIGASSLRHDPSMRRYPTWAYLPYITDSNFHEALGEAIREFGIGRIYTPNPVVWDVLNRDLKKLAPDVLLINQSPIDVELSSYRKALQFAQSVIKQPIFSDAALGARPAMPDIEIASLFRHAELIPGMCDHDKIHALCEIFRHCPQADVVEIGSWWGKSAFVLARLANCYGIGNLLCVDPWANENLIQNDEKGFVDRIPISADEALVVFQMNMLPYANGKVNYLRLPSTEAVEHYRQCVVLKTAIFGETTYCGKIAVLHIDGNHSYENAKADIKVWAGNLISGGWIVMDDYRWPYGDGPRRASDEFLEEHAERIMRAFYAGGALFMQVA